MGCCLSAPVLPDGDGVESLWWLTDANAKLHADYKHFIASLQPSQRECRFLINQEAIWNKLSGVAVEALPYPADDTIKALASYVHRAESRECRAWMNDEAIFNKLSCRNP